MPDFTAPVLDTLSRAVYFHIQADKISSLSFTGNFVPLTMMGGGTRMSKTKAIILAGCALILGVVGGALITRHVLICGFLAYMKLTSSGMEATSYTGAAQSVMLLDHLRRGDAQFPVESLEVQLDGDLIGLWAFYKDTTADKRDAHLLKLLAKIRDYREKYPRKTEHPEIDQTVAEVLAWAR
jgi:hypothetical protein